MDPDTGEIHRQTVTRAKVLPLLAKLLETTVIMEACGSAHDWVRKIVTLNRGHIVKRIAAQCVRPFVTGNKTNAADAQALWEVARQPGRRFVAMKSIEQYPIAYDEGQVPVLNRRHISETGASWTVSR